MRGAIPPLICLHDAFKQAHIWFGRGGKQNEFYQRASQILPYGDG
jgi:hypothetical protein